MRVFLSFLGLGKTVRNRATGDIESAEYQPARYCLGDRPVGLETPYVQAAILEHLSALGRSPDRVLIAVTELSRKWHWEKDGCLGTTLQAKRDKWSLGEIETIDTCDELDVGHQWDTFERILARIPAGCQLFVDMTHGFRLSPILLSSAIHFLMQTKNVELCGVYYGAFDASRQGETPIIDMKDFYAINRWAGAVQRLLQDANPDAIAELAASPTALRLQNLEDPRIVEALRHLSAVLKNSDAPHVADAASQVISLARDLARGASPSASVLLQMILDKFSSLAIEHGGKRFTRDWYNVQINMARVLLDHGLLMQGLTVLRELVVSWGEELAIRAMAEPSNPGRVAYLANHKEGDFKGRWFKQARQRVAEPFFARLHMSPEKWRPEQGEFDPDGSRLLGIMDGFFSVHFEPRAAAGSFEFLDELGKLRNSFNHAWTSNKKTTDHDEIQGKARGFFDQMERWTNHWLQAGVIGLGEASFLPGPTGKPRSLAPAPAVPPMFLNLSNHPVSTWSPEQLAAARALGLGEPTDLEGGMPLVPPEAEAVDVEGMADRILASALAAGVAGAHVSGEFTLTMALVQRLHARGIPCLIATSQREVVVEPRPDGSSEKRAIFRFVRWRHYPWSGQNVPCENGGHRTVISC